MTSGSNKRGQKMMPATDPKVKNNSFKKPPQGFAMHRSKTVEGGQWVQCRRTSDEKNAFVGKGWGGGGGGKKGGTRGKKTPMWVGGGKGQVVQKLAMDIVTESLVA